MESTLEYIKKTLAGGQQVYRSSVLQHLVDELEATSKDTAEPRKGYTVGEQIDGVQTFINKYFPTNLTYVDINQGLYQIGQELEYLRRIEQELAQTKHELAVRTKQLQDAQSRERKIRKILNDFAKEA